MPRRELRQNAARELCENREITKHLLALNGKCVRLVSNNKNKECAIDCDSNSDKGRYICADYVCDIGKEVMKTKHVLKV